MTKVYHYLYRITNVVNQKIYIGCHATDDLDDGYMGSGKYIRRAIDKYGIDNFRKEILSFHANIEEMLAAEARIITPEFLLREDVYNLALGGSGGYRGKDCYASADRNHKISLKNKNLVSCRLPDGTATKVTKEEFQTTELVGITKGQATVKDSKGTIFKVPVDDPRLANGQLVGVTKGKAVMKDLTGNIVHVSTDDPRIASGELTGVTKGSRQTPESNLRRSRSLVGVPKPQPMFTCETCGKTTSKTNIIRWHKNCKNDG